MAAKKSDLVKTYLNRVGTKDQYYMLLGNTSNTLEANDTNDAAITMWKDSEIAYKISRADTSAVVQNYTWSRSNVYIPWSSVNTNESKYYIYNKTNGIVYLCLSNNILNRKDLETKNASTIIPTHEFNVVRYEDGYEWLPLYKITPSLLKFVSNNWIPVVSLDDFFENESLNKHNQILEFCDENQGQTGNCGIYFKNNTSLPDSITGIDSAFESGSLFTTLTNISCRECFLLFEDAESEFVAEFFGIETPTSTFAIPTTKSKVKKLIDNNTLSSVSPYYWLYYANEYGIEDGCIISCFIDLSNFTESQLYVTTANPDVNIISTTGSGGSIRLKTYTNSLGEYVIEGIEIISRGSNYKDIKIEVPSGILKNISSASLVSSVEINLDSIDGLGIDPVKTLDARHVSTSARISLTELQDSEVTIPDSINFYGIVKNPEKRLTGETITVTAGTTTGKYKSEVISTVVSVIIDSPPTIPIKNDVIDSIYNSNDTSIQINDVIVSENAESGGFAGEVTTIKVKSLDDRGVLNVNTVTFEGVDYDIVGYQLPDLVFYSGSTETVKKITSLSVGSDLQNTKYFNITTITAL
jgi:hypothetical protein